ncbi:MAG TPA: sialidase family protein, partial [Pseudonocardiaceae bacterium]
MSRVLRLLSVVALLGLMLAPTATAADGPPLWVLHVQNHDGGISNGVRARLAASELDARTATSVAAAALPAPGDLDNVQANADCDPPLPQNETAVAFNPGDPMNAVAAANDYCGDGYWIGATFDGGHTWTSTFKDPKTSSGDRCFGSDPTVVYSVRDSAFYLATLCFFTNPISEVQVWKSTDGGLTWTDSTKAAIVITNQAGGGSIDGTVFYDKELLAVDNNPTSPHYGRVYV